MQNQKRKLRRTRCTRRTQRTAPSLSSTRVSPKQQQQRQRARPSRKNVYNELTTRTRCLRSRRRNALRSYGVADLVLACVAANGARSTRRLSSCASRHAGNVLVRHTKRATAERQCVCVGESAHAMQAEPHSMFSLVRHSGTAAVCTGFNFIIVFIV